MSDRDYQLGDFLARATKAEARASAIKDWHIQAFVVGNVELPYSFDENWINLNVHERNEETGLYEISPEKSLDKLALVAQYAASADGVTVEKNYGRSEFELEVTLADGETTVRYSANREAVCTKTVVGYKDIPERVTPARREEIVEWDCDPVSLLARKVKS